MAFPNREIRLADGGKIILSTKDGVTVQVTRFGSNGLWLADASGYNLYSAIRSLFEKRFGVLERSEAEKVEELVRYIESTKGRIAR